MWKYVKRERDNGRIPIMDPFNPPKAGPLMGVPLGGIGCGSVGRGWRGDFMRWQVAPTGIYISIYLSIYINGVTKSIQSLLEDRGYDKIDRVNHLSSLSYYLFDSDGGYVGIMNLNCVEADQFSVYIQRKKSNGSNNNTNNNNNSPDSQSNSNNTSKKKDNSDNNNNSSSSDRSRSTTTSSNSNSNPTPNNNNNNGSKISTVLYPGKPKGPLAGKKKQL